MLLLLLPSFGRLLLPLWSSRSCRRLAPPTPLGGRSLLEACPSRCIAGTSRAAAPSARNAPPPHSPCRCLAGCPVRLHRTAYEGVKHLHTLAAQSIISPVVGCWKRRFPAPSPPKQPPCCCCNCCGCSTGGGGGAVDECVELLHVLQLGVAVEEQRGVVRRGQALGVEHLHMCVSVNTPHMCGSYLEV